MGTSGYQGQHGQGALCLAFFICFIGILTALASERRKYRLMVMMVC